MTTLKVKYLEKQHKITIFLDMRLEYIIIISMCYPHGSKSEKKDNLSEKL